MTASGRYDAIIQRVFDKVFRERRTELPFEREELVAAAHSLGVEVPKNLGDLLYTYRFRRPLPDGVRRRAPEGTTWEIRGTGRGAYAFVAVEPLDLTPSRGRAVTRIPNSTPGVVAMYSLTDEQALLARIRYNRLIDIYTKITCYPLQSHLRTAVGGVQVETDDLYVGINRSGAHFVLPVQAKGARERLGVTQIEQDMNMCAEKFPRLVCRPIGAQFTDEDTIALFEFEREGGRIVVARECHYALVGPDAWNDDYFGTHPAQTRRGNDENNEP